jgi:ubiquinone/menaquinone biosynthesis C-methylase UbiE
MKPTFVQGDAARMPFAGGSFDAASISLALHEKDTDLQDAILSEMRRVVKRGGFLVLADFRAPLPRSLPGYAARLIERLAGGEHYSKSRLFQEQGGLTGVIARHNLSVIKESTAVGGTVRLALVAAEQVCQKPPRS